MTTSTANPTRLADVLTLRPRPSGRPTVASGPHPNPHSERASIPAPVVGGEGFAPLRGRRLLAVWAHPDDESFLAAGLLAQVAASGAAVVNLTATLGERGTDDPDLTPERLAAIRRRELTGALATLGPIGLDVLGLPDGDCHHVSRPTGARLIAAALRRHRPEVVVTFGPDGVTGHPDHRAVGHWTRRAIAAVDPGIAVIEAVTSTVWDRDLLAPLDALGAFFNGPPVRDRHPTDLVVALDHDDLDRKLAALGHHASQMAVLADRLGPDRYRRLFATEAYRPANAAALALLHPTVGAEAATAA